MKKVKEFFKKISAKNAMLALAIPCNGAATTTTIVNGVSVPACNFNTLIATFTNIIQWFFYVSVPIMVALLAWAGILYMTGVPNNIKRAHNMFINVAKGFIIMLIAFVVINTVVGWIGNSTFTSGSGTGSGASGPAVLLQQSSQ